MIVDQSREGTSPNGYKVGFPRSTYKWPDGRKKVVLVAFDFPDIKDPVDPVELLSEDVRCLRNTWMSSLGGRSPLIFTFTQSG